MRWGASVERTDAAHKNRTVVNSDGVCANLEWLWSGYLIWSGMQLITGMM
ncbi:hypothetical protein [Kangiella marina]